MRQVIGAIILSGCAGAAWAQSDANTWSTLQRGLYLTRVGDCAACHSVEGEEPYAGGLGLPTPFGTIYAANITPDNATGLGEWSQDEFYDAMTEGVRPDGKRLYPAFPYTHFTHVTREDSDAIFTYLNTLDPVRNDVESPEIPFPLNVRTAMRGWNMLFFDEGKLEPVEDKSEAWNRGRYLAEGLAHCGACHTPRNMLGAEKGGNAAYTGGVIEGWFAPSLRGGPGGEGLADWSEEDLAEFLRHGRNGRSAAFGPMAEVVEKSTRYLSDEDLEAIVAYFKDLPFGEVDGEAAEPVAEDDPAMTAGAEIYATQCSACHGPEGEGVAGQFAPIAGSSLAQSSDPTTVVRMILEGARAVPTEKYPTAQAMPAYHWKLSDEEVAQVATYVRNAFGNAAPAVSAGTVADLR
ncbi:c-type cytochrome [Allosediminivita pacifica]|uniref:Mono/diheme cytochrome c family protein n=1 Tax=Allosediminivita pacifica TaxID=1267769 RepID=A0A2T6AUD1_9RHOB|nr:c-type cytochrome [Allosediminivita pacifica]PTX47429.1 mono/diheme cytochrome c family protein [Allosediminivita pacifica]GGB14178.1 alcohol dehydrogenase [Allosediminivita pacifica]